MRMYEMSKMTLEQEEVRNQEYNEYVELRKELKLLLHRVVVTVDRKA